jgi:hypothetical protein
MKRIKLVLDLKGDDSIINHIRDYSTLPPPKRSLSLRALINRWAYCSNDLTNPIVTSVEITEEQKIRPLKVVDSKKKTEDWDE